MKQLSDGQVRDRVVDRRAEEDDPLVQQAAVDVELALATRGPFNHHRDQGHDCSVVGSGRGRGGRYGTITAVPSNRPALRSASACSASSSG